MEEERKIRNKTILVVGYAAGVQSMANSIIRSEEGVTFIDIETGQEKFRKEYMPIYSEPKIVNPDLQITQNNKLLPHEDRAPFSSKHKCTRHKKPRVKKKKTHLKKKRR